MLILNDVDYVHKSNSVDSSKIKAYNLYERVHKVSVHKKRFLEGVVYE